MGHQHFNGLKTTLLFSGIIGLLLLLGAVIGNGRYIWVFALLGLATTAYGYWNSDKIAIRSMRAYPVSEAEQPAMYRIVRQLSTAAHQPMPCRRRWPRTPSPPGATPATPRCAAPRGSCGCSTSASCAVSWAMS
jgi:heat shock protein HtpX